VPIVPATARGQVGSDEPEGGTTRPLGGSAQSSGPADGAAKQATATPRRARRARRRARVRAGHRVGTAGRLAAFHALALAVVLGAVVAALVHQFSSSYEAIAARGLVGEMRSFAAEAPPPATSTRPGRRSVRSSTSGSTTSSRPAGRRRSASTAGGSTTASGRPWAASGSTSGAPSTSTASTGPGWPRVSPSRPSTGHRHGLAGGTGGKGQCPAGCRVVGSATAPSSWVP